MSARWNRFRSLCDGLGTGAAVAHVLRCRFGALRNLKHRDHPLAKHPLWIRPRSSDPDVFRQIFVEREYSCLDDVSNVQLVIDCGANIGCSSAYFLSRYPECRVIAVEPDPGNFAVLRHNLAPYGRRVDLVRAGAWSHATRLAISAGYRAGREWAKQVRPARPNERSSLQGIDIGSLLSASGRERISILR